MNENINNTATVGNVWPVFAVSIVTTTVTATTTATVTTTAAAAADTTTTTATAAAITTAATTTTAAAAAITYDVTAAYDDSDPFSRLRYELRYYDIVLN